MKNNASSIEDTDLKPTKKRPRYPVWPGKSKAEIYALIEEELDHDAPAKKIAAGNSLTTSTQDDTSSIEDIELKPTKKRRGRPVWNGRRSGEKAPLLDNSSYQTPDKKVTTNNSLEILSKGQQKRQQDAHNKGPKETLEENSGCNTLLNICRQAAEKAVATEGETDRNVVEVLTGIAELKRLVSTNPAAERDLNQAYKAAGIRITGRTANPFTPMVKLVFPKKAQKPATVSRNASVLRLAEEENIEPSGLAGFVRQNGGLAACASRAVEKRRNAAGGSRPTATAAEEFVAARRRNAARIDLPDGLGLPKQGQSVLLVERAPKGGWLLLDCCEASAAMVGRFVQNKERPSAPAGRKRR